MRSIALSIFFLLTSSLLSNSYASLITNGSFESASVDPGSFLKLSVGSTSIDGWTVINDSIHYVGSYWQASDGVRSIDLDGDPGQAGGVQQIFATTPDTKYTVTFDMSGNLAGGPTVKSMRVIADGQSADFTFDITGISTTDMGYVSHAWTFIADDDFANLQFISLNTSAGWGPVIDNVSVNTIPIPASFLLFGSGLLGMVGLSRRKRSS